MTAEPWSWSPEPLLDICYVFFVMNAEASGEGGTGPQWTIWFRAKKRGVKGAALWALHPRNPEQMRLKAQRKAETQARRQAGSDRSSYWQRSSGASSSGSRDPDPRA